MSALARLRRDAGLTQKDVAAVLGVAQSRVSAVENADVATLTVATLNSYLTAVGRELSIGTTDGQALLDAPPSTTSR